MNRSIFMGRIGKDLALGQTRNGKVKLPFSIAVTKGEKTTWVPLVAYGKTAETIARFFKKGERILVEAEFTSYSYDKQDGSGKAYVHEFGVNSFEFIEPRQQPAQQGASTGHASGYGGDTPHGDYNDYHVNVA